MLNVLYNTVLLLTLLLPALDAASLTNNKGIEIGIDIDINISSFSFNLNFNKPLPLTSLISTGELCALKW